MTRVRPRALRTRPTVSVVVPCYKYGHYLPECVASALGQDAVEVDVLIVDDASPDDSAAVAHKLADADPRVRVIAHETNRGHLATYNEGLAAATGDYVVLLSADDLLTPGALGRAAALMEHHPDVGFVYGFSPVFADRPPAARTTARSWSVWTGPEWLELVCRQGRNPVGTPEVVMRGSVMRALGTYDSRLPHAADLHLWLRAAGISSVGRVNGADQAFYRVHGTNMHIDQFGAALTDLRERHDAFDLFLAEHGADLPAGTRDAMREAVARQAVEMAHRSGAGDAAAGLIAFAAELAPQVPVRRPHPVAALSSPVTSRLRWRSFRRHGLFGQGWLA